MLKHFKTAPKKPKTVGNSQNPVDKWTPGVVIRSAHHDCPFLTPIGRCLPPGVAFCVFYELGALMVPT